MVRDVLQHPLHAAVLIRPLGELCLGSRSLAALGRGGIFVVLKLTGGRFVALVSGRLVLLVLGPGTIDSELRLLPRGRLRAGIQDLLVAVLHGTVLLRLGTLWSLQLIA